MSKISRARLFEPQLPAYGLKIKQFGQLNALLGNNPSGRETRISETWTLPGKDRA
jgi:hypothetical protein